MKFTKEERALLRQGLIALDGDLRAQLTTIEATADANPGKIENIEQIRKAWNDRIDSAAALLVRLIEFETSPPWCPHCTGTVLKHQYFCPENARD